MPRAFASARRAGKPATVAELERAVHVVFIFAAVIDRADGIGVGHLFRPHEIAAAQFEAVEAEFARRLVDQPLDRKVTSGRPELR